MLEGLLANVLNRFLGSYVENLDAQKLNVGIWSGDVTLRSLELSRAALDQLHLPLNVVGGHISELTLQIPWSNLRERPLKINIEDVFLLAAPRTDADYDPDEDDRRAHKVKMDKLDNAELLKDKVETEGLSKEDQKKSQSFTNSLVTAMVDNVQVKVKNIHIRYEDAISSPGHPFALGFTLETFEAVSTNENWISTFIQSSTNALSHKLGVLKSLAIYWDTDATLLGSGGSSACDSTDNDYVSKLREMIARHNDRAEKKLNNHQYLLKPVTGRAGFEIDKSGKMDRPRIKSLLQFNELGFVMDDAQYRDALMLIDLFHYYIRHQEYRRFRPKVALKDDPKAWFRFAGQMVLDRIHKRNRCWTWDYIRERRDARRRYIFLFKCRKRKEILSQEETAEINLIEWKYSYEDLRFWRSLARAELRKENVKPAKAPQKQSWSQWLWAGNTHSHHSDDTDDSVEISEEERRKLCEAINWDENNLADEIDPREDYVKYVADLTLDRGSLTLKQGPAGSRTEIVRLLFETFRTKALVRRSSVFADLSLEMMKLFDGSTPGTRFPQLITITDANTLDRHELADSSDDIPEGTDELHAHALMLQRSIERSPARNQDPQAGDGEQTVSTHDPFFRLMFEHNPPDHSADNVLSIKLKTMEIVYNPQFLVSIVQFFRPPEMHMESIGMLMESAGEAVEGIRKQTRAGLEFALEEHKTLNLTLDLQAPLIILPDSVTQESNLCLIVDAGRIRVQSVLAEKDALKQFQAKQSSQTHDESQKELEDLMYDKFDLKLTSTQVLMGSSIEETRQGLEQHDLNLHIVDRIDVDFALAMCIVPRTTDLTRFRVEGHLPILQANVSDTKYRSLMKLIDLAIPNFDDDAEGEGSQPPRRPTLTQGGVADNIMGRPRGLSFSLAEPLRFFTADDDDDSSSFDDASDSETSSATTVSKNSAAKVEKPKKPVNWTQRTFEFTFTVDKFQGSLFKKTDLLADLVAENFRFQFFTRPYDFDATIRLQRFYIEDHVEKRQISGLSNIVTAASLSDQSQDLLVVHVVRTNSAPPDCKRDNNEVGIAVNVDISTINVVVSRTTLLTLLDFVLVTFTDQDAAPSTQQISQHPSEIRELSPSAPETDPTDNIKVRVELKQMAFILNNDGVQLATLSLESASVNVLLGKNTILVDAKLGDLQLVDDSNLEVPAMSPARRLLSIKGKEITHFKYQTFNPDLPTFPGYDMEVFLRTSATVNFLIEPFHNIFEFMVKFGKMQAIFNAAREAAAQRVNDIQQSSNRIHFDLLVHNPTVIFPQGRNTLSVDLGQVYLNNKFVPDDQKNVVNVVSAGLKKSRFHSCFKYPNVHPDTQVLDLLGGANITFTAKITETEKDGQHIDIEGSMSDTDLRLSRQQLRFITNLARTLPQAFDVSNVEVSERDAQLAVFPSRDVPSVDPPKPNTHGPGMSVSFVFSIGVLKLDLIPGPTSRPVESQNSFATFALQDVSVDLKLNKDDTVKSDVVVKSFVISDSRVMARHHDKSVQQLFISRFNISKPNLARSGARTIDAVVTIDKPQLVLSLDYIVGLKTFIDAGLAVPNRSAEPASFAPASTGPTTVQSGPDSEGNLFRLSLTVADSRVILLADPSLASTEAVVLDTQRILLTNDINLGLTVQGIGMFLCRMDRIEDTRLRILDNFDILVSLESQTLGGSSYSHHIRAEISPLVMRVSLRDVLMVMQIVNKANERTELEPVTEPEPPSRPRLQQPSSTLSTKSSSRSRALGKSAVRSLTSTRSPAATIRDEEFLATVKNIRLVIIGDTHALPMLDIQVDQFDIKAKNWSTRLLAETSIKMGVSVYNFSKSTWEPLIEPWRFQVLASRSDPSMPMSVKLMSTTRLEATVTPAMVSTAVQCAGFLSSNEDVLSKPRGETAPYRIRNLTGFDIQVWGVPDADQPSANRHRHSTAVGGLANPNDPNESAVAIIPDGGEKPWQFRDPRMARETLNPNWAIGSLDVVLKDSSFSKVSGIPVQREGETVYGLSPKHGGVECQLLVDVKLGKDNVKEITFRSPFLIENAAQEAVEVGIVKCVESDGKREWQLTKVHLVEAGGNFPVGVSDAYASALVIRPRNWGWSSIIRWGGSDGLFQKPTQERVCKKADRAFIWHIHAAFDPKSSLANCYPYMRVRILPPLQIQNLLPVEATFWVYDEDRRVTWDSRIASGATVPVHAVSTYSLLMMNITTDDPRLEQVAFKNIKSEDVAIKTQEHHAGERRNVLKLYDANHQVLRLKLHYHHGKNSGGSFRVSLYSPYVILNRTDRPICVKTNGTFGIGSSTAGEGICEPRKTMIFSFPTDDSHNRALIRAGDTAWSKPTSFDALGSANQVSLPESKSRRGQGGRLQLGIDIKEGEGPFRLVKVVTIAPRFVIHNTLGRDIRVKEEAQSNFLEIPAGGVIPLGFVKSVYSEEDQGQRVMVGFCLSGIGSTWSKPVDIECPPPLITLRREDRRLTIGLRVAVQGGSQTLIIGEPDESAKSDDVAKTGDQVDADTLNPDFQRMERELFNLSLAGLGVSLVSTREILYATVTDITAVVTDTPADIGISLNVNRIQIDNQLQGALKPIVLRVVSCGEGDEQKPAFSGAVGRSKKSNSKVAIIPYLSFLLQAIVLDLDEDFAFTVLDFLHATKLGGGDDADADEEPVSSDALASGSIPVASASDSPGGPDYLLHHFFIQPVLIEVSFSRSQRLNSEVTDSPSNPFAFILRVLSFSLGINKAPIRYNALVLNNALLSPDRLWGAVQMHYIQETMSQIHLIVGSADVLGNPVGLFNQVAGGITDIFYEPWLGLAAGDPREMGIGFAKGASSFLKKSISGFSDSVARVTGSFANGLAAATLDETYQTQRRLQHARKQPAHALKGLEYGGGAFVEGVCRGITSIGKGPIEGAARDGIKGMVEGIGLGFMRLAAMPIIGTLDMASNVAQGVRNTATVFDSQPKNRIRPPRYIPPNGVVEKYDENQAQGQLWLKQASDGAFFKYDYIGHLVLPEQAIVAAGSSTPDRIVSGSSSKAKRIFIVTYQALIMLFASPLKKDWKVDLSEIKKVVKEKTGITILLRGTTDGPFVPIPVEEERSMVYRFTRIAVVAFNREQERAGPAHPDSV